MTFISRSRKLQFSPWFSQINFGFIPWRIEEWGFHCIAINCVVWMERGQWKTRGTHPPIIPLSPSLIFPHPTPPPPSPFLPPIQNQQPSSWNRSQTKIVSIFFSFKFCFRQSADLVLPINIRRKWTREFTRFSSKCLLFSNFFLSLLQLQYEWGSKLKIYENILLLLLNTNAFFMAYL